MTHSRNDDAVGPEGEQEAECAVRVGYSADGGSRDEYVRSFQRIARGQVEDTAFETGSCDLLRLRNTIPDGGNQEDEEDKEGPGVHGIGGLAIVETRLPLNRFSTIT